VYPCRPGFWPGGSGLDCGFNGKVHALIEDGRRLKDILREDPESYANGKWQDQSLVPLYGNSRRSQMAKARRLQGDLIEPYSVN
jgi:hypothetical protein